MARMAESSSRPARLGGATISHPEKLFWPAEAITKLALAQFYARIAAEILPWMKSRAVTMERCPEGIRKTCFYQKQAPKQLAADIPTVRIPARPRPRCSFAWPRAATPRGRWESGTRAALSAKAP